MATRLVRTEGRETPRVAPWLFPAAFGAFACAFLVAPGSLAAKSHAALHGLCAQIPSHSLTFGGQRLPLDARMTGIYAGAFVTVMILAAAGRWRATGFAPVRVWPLLAIPVLLLAIDGSNSLARDLRLPTLYPPSNELRLATGLLTGVSLGVAVCTLLSGSLWRRGTPGLSVLTGVGEWLGLAVAQVPVALLLLSGVGWLSGPAALFLVVSSLSLVGALVLTSGLILSGRDGRYETVADLAVPATAALFGAVAVMAMAAGGRVWLESVVGQSPLT